MSAVATNLPKMAIPRGLSAAVLGLCLMGAAALILWQQLLPSLQQLCVAADVVDQSRCLTAPNKLLGYIAMISAFPAVLLLERFIPAAKSQGLFSRGVLVDFIWFCFTPVLFVLVVLPFEGALQWVYGELLGLGKVNVIGLMPVPLQIVTVVLISDFMSWLAHYVRHKSFFWEFHKIHHSQEELNYFSTARIHPFDSITITLVRFLPFALLDARIAVPAFAVTQSFIRIYEMYTHSNLRINMGPLRYILVTPQSHRVHHSMEAPHIDKNFGNFLSIWDRIFGTQVNDADTYPLTGVHDKAVPAPVRGTLADSLAAYLGMLVYPFKVLWDSAVKSRGDAAR